MFEWDHQPSSPWLLVIRSALSHLWLRAFMGRYVSDFSEPSLNWPTLYTCSFPRFGPWVTTRSSTRPLILEDLLGRAHELETNLYWNKPLTVGAVFVTSWQPRLSWLLSEFTGAAASGVCKRDIRPTSFGKVSSNKINNPPRLFHIH